MNTKLLKYRQIAQVAGCFVSNGQFHSSSNIISLPNSKQEKLSGISSTSETKLLDNMNYFKYKIATFYETNSYVIQVGTESPFITDWNTGLDGILQAYHSPNWGPSPI